MESDVMTDDEILTEEPEVEEVDEIEEELEEKEESEELEDKKEIKEKSSFPFERPQLKEIKAKFPELFKEFPTIRDSLFQEIEYRKIFPTIEDAKDAVDNNIAFDGLRDSVLSGDIKPLLSAVDETDSKSLNKLAHGFLPALKEKSTKVYGEVITPLFENFVRQLGNSRDENERNAALVAARFLFGADGDAIVEGKKTFVKDIEETEDEKRVRSEREKLSKDQYNGFYNLTHTEIELGLTKVILRGLDPDNTMTEKSKQMLIKDIKEEVDRVLRTDENHIKVMNSHWLRARRKGFNTASKDTIISAYLSRAKQVVGPIRDKARNEFLGVRKKSSEKTAEKIISGTRPVVTGKAGSGSSSSKVVSPRKIDWRKTSDLDVLNDNITERG